MTADGTIVLPTHCIFLMIFCATGFIVTCVSASCSSCVADCAGVADVAFSLLYKVQHIKETNVRYIRGDLCFDIMYKLPTFF